MIRLLTIIGARPQIIKAAAVSRAVREAFAGQIEEKILHTGQHYDDNMSEVFFRELGIPQPDYNLHVGSGTHGVQTGAMLQGIERILLEQHFDGMIVYGDTNSTLAGALAASKLQVPLFHVEAGLRSYNMTMPEEINRIVADRLGNLLFAPTETAVRNLRGEGINELTNERVNELTGERVNELTGERFANGRTQKVVLSGDVMYDNSMYFSAMADEKSDIIERLGLKPKQFVLATIHRPANTDNKENLRSIFRALSDIASSGIDVVVPLHPRTRGRLNELTGERINELTGERFANGRTQKVVLSGDVMYDNSMYFSAMADEKSDIIERLGRFGEHRLHGFCAVEHVFLVKIVETDGRDAHEPLEGLYIAGETLMYSIFYVLEHFCILFFL